MMSVLSVRLSDGLFIKYLLICLFVVDCCCLGNSLLVKPVTKEGVTSVDVYFPGPSSVSVCVCVCVCVSVCVCMCTYVCTYCITIECCM